MRKNKMMRVASALLVAVLLSTCAISSTFAKYVTSDSSGDVARVAKWGVVLQIEGDLYATQYETNPNNNTATATTTDDSFSVSGTYMAPVTNVVAPGTSSDGGISIKLTGQPEVATEITTKIETQNIYLKKGEYAVMVELGEITEETFGDVGGLYTVSDEGTYTLAESWTLGTTYYTMQDYVDLTDDYYPVVYNLVDHSNANSSNSVTGSINSDSLDAVADKILELANGAGVTTNEVNKEYAANTDLSGLGLSDLSITWAWAFEQPAEGEGENMNTASQDMYNAADTILANLMAKRIDGDTGTDFVGEVVKLGADNSTYSAPQEHADYCLDTRFNIEITVTQVD